MKPTLTLSACVTVFASLSWGTNYNIDPTAKDTDDGKCSLAEAATAINTRVAVHTNDCAAGSATANTITLQAGVFGAPKTYVVTVPLVFTGPVSIVGGGIDRTVIAANFSNSSYYAFISFESHSGYDQSGWNEGIRGVTVQQNASITTTSGIFCDWGSKIRLVQCKIKGFGNSGVYGSGTFLGIDSSSIEGNTSPGGGGGIHVDYYSSTYPGNLAMMQSSVTGNGCGGDGGGIYHAVQSGCNFVGLTVANNQASGSGGGIYVNGSSDPAGQSGYVDLHGCTITGNSANSAGGGLYFEQYAPNVIHAYQTLIAGNTASTYPDIDGYVENENTLFGENSGLSAPMGTGSKVRSSPGIGKLHETGWPLNIKMIPIPATSLAVDSTDSTAPTIAYLSNVDGRGQDGLADGNQDGYKTYDFGAYEYNPLLKETDSLKYAKSNDSLIVQLDHECSGDTCSRFFGSGTSSYITYLARVYRTGTYNLKARMKKNNNRATFQLSWANSLNGSYTNIGSVQDLYASVTSFTVINFGNVTFNSTGAKAFKFQVTGKNASSSGYQLYFDYLKLTGP